MLGRDDELVRRRIAHARPEGIGVTADHGRTIEVRAGVVADRSRVRAIRRIGERDARRSVGIEECDGPAVCADLDRVRVGGAEVAVGRDRNVTVQRPRPWAAAFRRHGRAVVQRDKIAGACGLDLHLDPPLGRRCEALSEVHRCIECAFVHLDTVQGDRAGEPAAPGLGREQSELQVERAVGGLSRILQRSVVGETVRMGHRCAHPQRRGKRDAQRQAVHTQSPRGGYWGTHFPNRTDVGWGERLPRAGRTTAEDRRRLFRQK